MWLVLPVIFTLTSDSSPLDATQCHVPEGLNQLSKCLSKAKTLHKQLTTIHHINPSDLCGGHVTFSHSPLVLPSLNNMLPAMVLQNRVVWSNTHQLNSLSHSSIHHVFLRLGLSVSYSLKMVGMVMVLLLLLSGDIETNPGPDGEYCKCCVVERNWNETNPANLFCIYHFRIPFLIFQGKSWLWMMLDACWKRLWICLHSGTSLASSSK